MKYLPFYLTFIAFTLFACGPQPKVEDQTTVEQPEQKEWKWFWDADWHPSQDQIALGGRQDTLRILSSSNLQYLKNYPYKGTITKAKWHPTKDLLAITVQDGLSKPSLINVETDEQIELDSVTSFGARAVAWNRDGSLLAVGDYEGMLIIFDQAGNFLKKVDTEQKAIIDLDWHPEENLLVAVGEYISIYDYTTDTIKSFQHRQYEVLMLCVDWHPDGTFFTTGDYGDFEFDHPPLLQYWTRNGEQIKSIEKSVAEYRDLEWSGDGELLATASEKIRLWDKDGNLVVENATESLLWGVAWQPDGSQLITADDQENVILWDRKLNVLKYGK